MIALLLSHALAADIRPVRAGDTVESLAELLGDVTLAETIRTLNALGPGEQPRVGTLVELPPPLGAHGDQRAFLITLKGDATVTVAPEDPVPVATFEAIAPGAELCTGEDSHATLRLASQCNDDGSLTDDVVLSPETCLVVDSAFSTANARSTVVRVTKGSVRVRKSQASDGHVTIVTPSGITTGSQGGYRVTIEAAAARTEALYAAVAVQGAGEEVALDAGQGSRVETGKAPGAPVDLLVTGELRRPPDDTPLIRPSFGWDPVDTALGYRLEIAADPAFVGLIFADDVSEPRFDVQVLMLPYDRIDRVYWRVASFDRLGFLGIPSEARSLRMPIAR